MVNSSFTDAEVPTGGCEVVVQGFRAGESRDAYVYIGLTYNEGEGDPVDIALTPENAHILSEEVRKHAEFAQSVREEGE